MRLLEMRPTALASIGFAYHLTQRFDDLRDVAALDDQRRRQSDHVPGLANHDAALEALEEHFEGSRTRLAGARLEFDRPDQTVVADVDHVRQSAHRMHGGLPCGTEGSR